MIDFLARWPWTTLWVAYIAYLIAVYSTFEAIR